MSKTCICLLLLALLSVPVAFAQSMAGTLTGTVTDASGAVIPNANVTARNESSGDLRKTVTNGEGYFTISSLPAATYTLTAESGGFGKWERTGLVLNGGDKRNVTVTLTVATSTVQVDVVSTAAEVATVDSGERAQLITANQIQNLAIAGRNAAELVKILPGALLTANNGQNKPAYSGEVVGINAASLAGNAGGLGGTNINGSSVDISQDGAHTNDPGAPGSATPVNPNTEMVQEVKVSTASFGAENAKGPVVMNTVSKSGGRDFHGTGYLYAKNGVLNANEWINNTADIPKPESSYYFPGANLGGPVLIPGTRFNKDRNKLFFFEGFEYYKQTIDGGVMRAFVPTEDMRKGDFSKVNTYGPLQGNLGTVPNFPGGIIPQSAVDPGGQVLINLYPMPNADPLTNNGYNYKNSLVATQNSWQSLSRVDYSVSDSTKIFVRYNIQRELQNNPTGLWGTTGSDNQIPYPTNIKGNNASDAVAGSLVHVFSPSMTSETTFGYTKINFPNEPEDPSKLLKSEANYPYKGIYNTSKSLPVVMDGWSGGMPSLGTAGYSYNPRLDAVKGITTFGENLAKVYRTHTLKFGAYFEQVYNRQDNWNQSNGTISFSPWNSATGNNYADLLTGTGFSYTEQKLPPQSNIGQRILDFYAQDSWKVTRRLTLEFGMRFQHLPGAYDRGGDGMAIFDPTLYNNDPAALSDRTGLTWHKINSKIPLSGADSRLFFYSPRFGMAWDIFGTAKTVMRGGWGKFRSMNGMNGGFYVNPWNTAVGGQSFSCGYPDERCPTLASIDAIGATYTPDKPGLGNADVMDPNNDEQPLTTSYNFTIAQVLPHSIVFEAAYVGNQSKYGMANMDINAVPIGAMTNDPTGNQDSYRPRTNYQAINQAMSFIKSDYNSLQLSATRNVGRVSLQTNYTFSKQMGSNGNSAVLPNWGQDYYWGVLPANRAHGFNAAYSVELPNFVHGRGFAKVLANGWQVSGITQIQSGADVRAASSNTTHMNASRPNVNGISELGTPGFTPQAVLLCDPRSNLKPGQYVNGACYGAPPLNGIGTGAFPYVPGPAYVGSDLSLFKNFAVSERQKLQLRFSAFNFLNHPLRSFRGSDSNLNLSFDAEGNMTNPRFGYADTKFGHRIIELAVKYYF